MKKSLLAMLCVLFGLVAVPLAYADEEMTDDAGAATMQDDEPLPPLMDESSGT